MKILIFGASGMVGQGVLFECLRDPEVELAVTVGRGAIGIIKSSRGMGQPMPLAVTVGRGAIGIQSPKLRQIVHHDLGDYGDLEEQLTGFDACFFSLGVSSGGMKEAEYDRITYGLTLAAAETLSRLNPAMTFIYVSGAGTDSSDTGRIMWARVKGRTENALLCLPFHAYMFRPGLIQPLDGIQSKTPAYRILYSLTKPLLPLLRRAFPNAVVTTREIGLAMLAVAKRGYQKRILETKDLRSVIGD